MRARDFLLRAVNFVLRRVGLRLEILRKAPPYPASRFEYQSRYFDFGHLRGKRVLDIGSGSQPFPYATVLADRYLADDSHRGGDPIVLKKGLPLVVCDVQALPFADKSFDYVVCSHVLEHVPDPEAACDELMRVAPAGFIEVPTMVSDVMLNYTYSHKWHVHRLGNRLIFIEYTDWERQGTGMTDFEEMLHSRYDNPFRRLALGRREFFATMFEWRDKFDVIVIRDEGE